MKEYWVNVYPKNILGGPLESREQCIRYNPSAEYIYRLHVKVGAKSSRAFYPYVWKDGRATFNDKIYRKGVDRVFK